MYKDLKKPDETKILNSFMFSVKDFKNGLTFYKNYLFFIGFILTLTALFLGIESDNIFLKRVQALLLLVSITSLSSYLIASLKVFFYKKHAEMYYAFAVTIIFICLLFIFDLFFYLFTNFGQELSYYLHWAGIPLIGIVVNILSIYFFKLFKKYKNIGDYRQFEIFFLFTLNWNLVITYLKSNYNFFQTIKNLFSFRFSSIFLLITFFVIIWTEIRDNKNKTQKSKFIELIFALMVIIISILIYFIFIM